MKPQQSANSLLKVMYISKQDADKARASRGFASFREWERQNTDGQARLKARLAERGVDKGLTWQAIAALERERREMIAPNL